MDDVRFGKTDRQATVIEPDTHGDDKPAFEVEERDPVELSESDSAGILMAIGAWL